MGGRLWLGLLLLLPLGAAIAAADESRPSAVATAAAEEPTAVKVVSGDTVLFRTGSGLLDTWTGEATEGKGSLLMAGECPDATDLSVSVVADVSHVEIAATPEPVESTCLVTLVWDTVAFSAPVTGHLVVAVDGLDDATVGYSIERTSGFIVFLAVGAVAAAYGAAGARSLRQAITGKSVPSTWSFKDSWIASLTGLTTAAAGLYALTGVLDEYTPQYSLGGVLAANFVVGILVLLAPVAFAAVRGDTTEEQRCRGFVVAGALSLAAAAAQLCVIAVVVVSGSTNGLARLTTGVLLAGALGYVFGLAVHQAKRISGAPSASI
jgi:hypothetical protein